jgi:hypothetical protein
MHISSIETETNTLTETLAHIKQELKSGRLSISFGTKQHSVVTEVCVDVFEKSSGQYRHDLSVAFKR